MATEASKLNMGAATAGGIGTQPPPQNEENAGNVKDNEFLAGYIFEGISSTGRVEMPISAPSEAILREWLESGHIEVVKIKKRKGSVSGSKKVKPRDIANFVGQLADRKAGGQGEIDAIRSCADATDNIVLRRALREIVERMEHGVAPDEAFRQSYLYNPRKKKHTDRKTFPKELIHQIQAGKRGQMVKLLKDYERRLNRSIEKKAEVISELIYPAITVLLAIILSQVMVFVVIPQFAPLYEGILGDKNMQLPLLTRIVVGTSTFATSYLGIAVILSTLAAVGYFIYWATRTRKGIIWRQERELFLPRIGYGKFTLNLQFISELLIAYQGSVHLTSLGQVMKATDIVTALKEIAEGSPHVVYARLFNDMATTIEKRGAAFAPSGRPYSHLLHRDFYPLMETGAQGDMSEQVLKLADQLEEDFQRRLTRIMKLITPATVVFLGVVIGAVIIAMYLPMLDIIGRMAGK